MAGPTLRRDEERDSGGQEDRRKDECQQHLPAQARGPLAFRFELVDALDGGGVEKLGARPAL